MAQVKSLFCVVVFIHAIKVELELARVNTAPIADIHANLTVQR